MPLIKRYPNRKLYDTEAKQYITLDGIAALIRRGEDVQVIDYASGEDLTTLTLTQIILEEEKRQSGFLPRSVLSGLVRAGGETMGSLQRTLANSLGWWTQFDEEIKRRLDELVSQGEMSAKEARNMWSKLRSTPSENRDTEISVETKAAVENALRERGIPTRKDVDQIAAQLEELEKKISSLEGAGDSNSKVRDGNIEMGGTEDNK